MGTYQKPSNPSVSLFEAISAAVHPRAIQGRVAPTTAARAPTFRRALSPNRSTWGSSLDTTRHPLSRSRNARPRSHRLVLLSDATHLRSLSCNAGRARGIGTSALPAQVGQGSRCRTRLRLEIVSSPMVAISKEHFAGTKVARSELDERERWCTR